MNTATYSIDWLVLLHQLPAKPPYLRVKIWRNLQTVGAMPLKNAVHLLPKSDVNERALRDLQDQIIGSGGEATIMEGKLLAGQGDSDMRAMFDAARDAEYQGIVHAARNLIETGPPSGSEIDKLHRRLADVAALDFFGAHGRQGAEAALKELEQQRYRHPDVARHEVPPSPLPEDLKGKTWVTRRGVHVDRIACAWLIRRFIDPHATFRFIDGRAHLPAHDELRFDMVDAEFTHEGDRCSFETILLRTRLDNDASLVAIGQIIHELDIADGKFSRGETAGVGALLSGICASTRDELERIARGGDALDQFYTYFSRLKG